MFEYITVHETIFDAYHKLHVRLAMIRFQTCPNEKLNIRSFSDWAKASLQVFLLPPPLLSLSRFSCRYMCNKLFEQKDMKSDFTKVDKTNERVPDMITIQMN